MSHRPNDASALRAFERFCRQHRLAMTVQRRIIYGAIHRREDHPTADQIYEAVHEKLPDVSRTTVYRALEMFVRRGLITKACHPGASARYDPITTRHHHLVCMQCEQVTDLDDDLVEAVRVPRALREGFEVVDYRIHFRGLCRACRAARRGEVRRVGQKRKPSES